MTAVFSLAFASQALALPQGGQVVGGQASIATSGSQTTITQTTHRGIINWQSFDIGQGEGVHFQQPSASSVTLNRVTGGQGASQLLGSLTANGTVMLLNPQGTFIGPSANVNVGSFLATTSDITDDRFMAGDYRFDKPGNPDAGIVNQGTVTVADAGLAAFVAANVVNNGLIQARLGKVQLASGDTFTLDLYGDGLFALEAGPAITSQLVSNGGIIAAEGGKVLLTAAAAGEVVNSLINMDGIISATSIGERNGEIMIFAEGSNAVVGNDLSKKRQKQGSSTVLVSGVLDASGRGEGERGGKITVTGDNVALLAGTIIDASGNTGLAGTTEGKAVSAHRDGSAGGDIRIGGDYLGKGDTPTAMNLFVDPGALIVNDALFTGDAGRSIFWSDGTTQFYGNVYARAWGGQAVNPLTWNATGGGNHGDGGFVETSGYEHLDAGGYVNLTTSNGDRGTYFLDPTDITIYGNVDPAFMSTDGSIDLGAKLELWLDGQDSSTISLSGAFVTQWNDKSSKGNHVTQSTNADQPGIGQINGHQAISFDNDFLTRSGVDLSIGTDASLFTTVSFSTIAANTNGIVSYYLNAANNLSLTQFSATGSLFGYAAAGGPRISRANYFTSNTPVLLGYLNNASSLNAYGNGVSLATGTAAGSIGAGGALNVGTYTATASQAMQGTIGDVIFYNTALGTVSRQVVEQYQSAKWGVAITPPGTGGTEAAKAMASDGYSAFTTRYLERLSQTADISLQATNSITLDLQGDTLALTSDRNFSLTTTNGNISSVSAGTIGTTRSGSGGNITMTAGGTGAISLTNVGLNAQGGGLVSLSAGGGVSVTSSASLNLGTVSGTSVLLRTTGATDITLNNTISASGSGTAITLAAGRNIINNAGGGALSAPSGRWLAYSTNPGNDTPGGLTNGFRRFSCTYGGSCPSLPASGNGFLYSYTPTLTATPSVGFSVTYGDAAPNLSAYAYTLSGYLGSDAAIDALTGSLNGSTPYAAGSNVASYAINHASGSLASELGYGFTYASSVTGLNVTPKTVTASLTGTVRKTFNGTAAAILTPANYLLPGVLAGDNVFLNNPSSGTFNSSEVGTGKLVTVTGLALIGADSGNYLLGYPVVSANIGQIDSAVPALTPQEASRIQFIRPRYEPLPPVYSNTSVLVSAEQFAVGTSTDDPPVQLSPASDGRKQRVKSYRLPLILVDPDAQKMLGLPPLL